MQHRMTVCIEQSGARGVVGKIYCTSFEAPREFHDIHEMLLAMETIMDELNYPAASTQHRTFEPTQTPRKKHWSV